MSCPKIPIQLSRRINEIRTSLLDGTRIEVTIERLTTPRNIIDEKDSSRTHTYKRDTTLVTIKRLLRPVQEESESSLATSAQSQVKNHENIDKTCDASTGCDASHNHNDKVESQNKGENQAQNDSLRFCDAREATLGIPWVCPDCGTKEEVKHHLCDPDRSQWPVKKNRRKERETKNDY